MLHKLKTLIASISLLFAFAVPIAAPAVAFADSPSVQGSLCTGATKLQISSENGSTANCKDDSSGGESKVNKLIKQIINLLSVIVGVIAVIMIIVGGFRYITSGGSDTGIASAKKTILYALIGLVIVALAQI